MSWSRGRSKDAKPVNCCFKDKKVFCIVSWRVMKNGYAMIIWSGKNHGAGQANYQHRRQSRIFMASSSIFGGISWVYIMIYSITGENVNQQQNWCNWAKTSVEAKTIRLDTAKRHDKVIFQHDNAQP